MLSIPPGRASIRQNSPPRSLSVLPRDHFKYVHLYTNPEGTNLPLSNFGGRTGLSSLGHESFGHLCLLTEMLILQRKKEDEGKSRWDQRPS